MMNDKELLELAAKAAGYSCGIRTTKIGIEKFYINGHVWNPLDDDGDALRLAVKLNLTVCSGPVYSYVVGCTQEKNNGDPYAATRRAIVLAAAGIGKWEGE